MFSSYVRFYEKLIKTKSKNANLINEIVCKYKFPIIILKNVRNLTLIKFSLKNHQIDRDLHTKLLTFTRISKFTDIFLAVDSTVLHVLYS